MGSRTKARECAFQMLYQWEISDTPMEKVVESFWRVRHTTPATRAMADRLATGAAVLLAAALAASFLPARRATTVDPAETLRGD